MQWWLGSPSLAVFRGFGETPRHFPASAGTDVAAGYGLILESFFRKSRPPRQEGSGGGAGTRQIQAVSRFACRMALFWVDHPNRGCITDVQPETGKFKCQVN
jgi:hypothetical protein